MNIDELDKLLAITDGALTIAPSTLPGDGILQLLVAYNQGQPIVVSGAVKTVETMRITVTGTSPFMRVAGLGVTATFAIDAQGAPQATFVYALIGANPGPGAWTFARSFPDLPPFGGTSGDAYLAQLNLSSASYVLTTAPTPSPLSAATLAPGLNFCSKAAPDSIAGLFDSALGKGPLIVEGPIAIPPTGQLFPPVPNQAFPWGLPGPTPGILLKADLGATVSISGALQVTGTRLFIYTPLTSAWLAANPSYKPLLVLTGTLAIPSLGYSVDLSAFIVPGTAKATIVGRFHGVTFDALSKLTDLLGGDGLLAALPADIHDGVEKIAKASQLQLDRFSLLLGGSFSGAGVQAASVTIGLPGLDWKPVDGFDLGGFSVQFLVVAPFTAARAVTALLAAQVTIADAKFDVAFQVPDFAIFARLDRDSSVDLTRLFADHLPALPTPPALVVNEMSFNAKPGDGSFDFFVGMAEKPQWVLDVTPTPITIYDVRAHLRRGAGGMAGDFSGSIDIGHFIELTASYSVPGGFMIRSDIPSVKLSELIGLVSNIDIVLPSGFDFFFDQTFVLIEGEQDDLTFSAGTTVSNFGLLVLTAQRLGGKWNFGFGMDVAVGQIGAIPGLGIVERFTDFVGLEDLLLVVSASDVSKFVFPDTASFNAPSLGSKNIQLPAQAGAGLTRGLNLYAKISASKNQGFKLFADYAGIKLDGSVGGTLAISLPDPDTNSKFFLSIDFKINDVTTVAGELGVLLQGPDIGVFLSADVKTKLQRYPVEFIVTGIAVDAGAFISGSARGVLPKFDITPTLSLQFSNLALEIGIDVEGIPSFGFMGTLSTSSGFDSSIAVFFDSINPSKSLIAGAISNITLFDVIDTFTDGSANDVPQWLKDALSAIALKGLNAFTLDAGLAEALDNLDLAAISTAFAAHHVTVSTSSSNTFLVVEQPGKIWSLTTMNGADGITHYQLKAGADGILVDVEAQLYLAPAETTMLGGFAYPRMFKATGEIEFLFLDLVSDTAIAPSQGIKINETIKPIDWQLGGVPIFSLSGANGTGGATLSVCTYSDPTQPDPRLQGPHFLLSGALKFLDFVSASAYVDIRKEGAAFGIKGTAWAMTLELAGHFTALTDMGAAGTAALTLGTLDLGDAGKIAIDTGVTARLDLRVSNPNNDPTFTGTATLSVEILGHQFDIVNANISVDAHFFEHLGSSIMGLIEDAVLALPAVWLKWVEDGLITIAKSVAELLKDVFSISSWRDAAKLMWEAGFEFLKIAEEVAEAFAVALSDVWDFLESLVADCAMASVNRLTNDFRLFDLFAVARDSLAAIPARGDGDRLLYLFYSNKDALQDAIARDPRSWHNFAGGADAAMAFAETPADRVIAGLTEALPNLPRAGRHDAAEAITILDRYRGTPWAEMRHKVGGPEGSSAAGAR
jgi:hypothetical protein